MSEIQIAELVDTRGMLCPMPIVLANKTMKRLGVGDVMKVLATDKGALKDFPAWASDTGNEIVSSGEVDGALVFLIRKGEGDD
jgi:tRNA 2-thiouridine synthesizing protein A